MFRSRRVLIGLFLPFVLLAVNIFAANAFAQKVRAETVAYEPPTLSLSANPSAIRLCGGEGTAALVRLDAVATSPTKNPISYRWTSDVGSIQGNGAVVTWDLSGVRPGYYKAFVEIDTGNGDQLCKAFASTAILVECPPLPPPPCPSVSITCPAKFEVGEQLTFTSALSGSLGNIPTVYNWTVSSGRIIEGQGTSSIKVDTTGLAGQTLTANLSMGGYTLDCSASCSLQFPVPLSCRAFDQFPAITRNEEKARLDNFAIELQNDPAASGYVIIYPGEHGRPGEVQTHSARVVDYLVNSRGLDKGRIVTVVGPVRPSLMIKLWVCPQGATPR
jgi:hypothetical protein